MAQRVDYLSLRNLISIIKKRYRKRRKMASSLIYHPASQEEFDKIVAETSYTALVDFYAEYFSFKNSNF